MSKVAEKAANGGEKSCKKELTEEITMDANRPEY
jgi:hypothetical protein